MKKVKKIYLKKLNKIRKSRFIKYASADELRQAYKVRNDDAKDYEKRIIELEKENKILKENKEVFKALEEYDRTGKLPKSISKRIEEKI